MLICNLLPKHQLDFHIIFKVKLLMELYTISLLHDQLILFLYFFLFILFFANI